MKENKSSMAQSELVYIDWWFNKLFLKKQLLLKNLDQKWKFINLKVLKSILKNYNASIKIFIVMLYF